MAQVQLGIDIGNRSVHLVGWDGKRVSDPVVEPLPEGLVREGRIVSPAAMADFLKGVRKQNRVHAKTASLVLHTNECFCRRFDVPAMTHQQLKVNLSYEFRDFITQEKEKYFYDYAILDTLDEGKRLDLMAAAVAKETIGLYEDILRKVGWKLKVAVPEEIAYINLLSRFGQEATAGSCCLLDLGHSAVAIHMFRNGRHQSGRNLDYGCAALDDAIAEQFSVAPYVACGYRETNYQDCQSLPQCQEIYNFIALEVLKAVNYYNYSNADQPVEQVFCWGGGMRIQPLLDALSGTLSVPVRSWEELLPGLEKDPGSLLALGAALQRG